MKVLALSLALLVSTANAYVPTVESLFRNGSNPDVVGNGLTLNLSVSKVTPGEESSEKGRDQEFYKIYFTKAAGDSLKIGQSRFSESSYSDQSLNHKVYFSNFTSHTLKATPDQMERGLFMAMLNSMMLNNGSLIVNYLKNLGAPVKLNAEILNRDKVEELAKYKRYLMTVGANRAAKKTEVNPLRPDDASAKNRVDKIMDESMYVDLNQVKMGRDEGQLAWLVSAGNFEAVFSYKERFLQKLKFKSGTGDFEVICKDYWMPNGTHSLPKTMLIKSQNGEQFQVEISNLRHYVEKDQDIAARLKKWDTILKGKNSADPRPEFLL